MSTKKELLEKALEAIKINHEWHIKHDEHDGYSDSTIHDVNHSAIKVIETELAKPDTEPVGYVNPDHINNIEGGRYSARIWKEKSDNGVTMPIYTSPRPMQRLTVDEMQCLSQEFYRDPIAADIVWARFVESALIEKNK
jgi:hypothetical protein